MSNTTGDFWRMMWETKSAAIIMLTELTEDEQVRRGRALGVVHDWYNMLCVVYTGDVCEILAWQWRGRAFCVWKVPS